jgi:diguanylate cyclase
VNELREGVARIGFHFRGTPVSVTISICITAFQLNDSAGAAFDRADKALYKAKEAVRNRCVAS